MTSTLGTQPDYLFAGRPLTVHQGQIAFFRAAHPHGLLDASPSDVAWVHVPLTSVLGRQRPEGLPMGTVGAEGRPPPGQRSTREIAAA